MFRGPNNIFTILSQHQTGECYCPTSDIATWAIKHSVLCSRGIVKTLFAAQKILLSFLLHCLYISQGVHVSQSNLLKNREYFCLVDQSITLSFQHL